MDAWAPQDCPAGSECLQFNSNPPTTGCLVSCQMDMDCRSDAFCLEIQGAPFYGACIPDCRDDFWDCRLRDGSQYCNPNTGRFIPDCDLVPSKNAAAEIGDPCVNSTDCAPGHICLGEEGWPFDNGLCTQVCSGLPEAVPCPSGSTCQTMGQSYVGRCRRLLQAVCRRCLPRSGWRHVRFFGSGLGPSPGCYPPPP